MEQTYRIKNLEIPHDIIIVDEKEISGIGSCFGSLGLSYPAIIYFDGNEKSSLFQYPKFPKVEGYYEINYDKETILCAKRYIKIEDTDLYPHISFRDNKVYRKAYVEFQFINNTVARKFFNTHSEAKFYAKTASDKFKWKFRTDINDLIVEG